LIDSALALLPNFTPYGRAKKFLFTNHGFRGLVAAANEISQRKKAPVSDEDSALSKAANQAF